MRATEDRNELAVLEIGHQLQRIFIGRGGVSGAVGNDGGNLGLEVQPEVVLRRPSRWPAEGRPAAGEKTLMEVFIKMLLALAVVAVLAAIMASSIVPAIMLAAVGYSLYFVWRGLHG